MRSGRSRKKQAGILIECGTKTSAFVLSDAIMFLTAKADAGRAIVAKAKAVAAAVENYCRMDSGATVTKSENA